MLPSEEFIALLVVAVVTGAAVVTVLIVTVRAADGRLDRNSFAGIRTRATMRSDEAWQVAHRAARPATTNALGVFLAGLLGGSVASLFLPSDTAISTSIIVGTFASLTLIIIGCVRGHRAAARLGDHQPTA